MIQVTSKLFGIITIPTSAIPEDDDTLDVWYSFGAFVDINVYDIGDGKTQATLYPVKNGIVNTSHILESLQGDSIYQPIMVGGRPLLGF